LIVYFDLMSKVPKYESSTMAILLASPPLGSPFCNYVTLIKVARVAAA
jgi:hypothetical protein